MSQTQFLKISDFCKTGSGGTPSRSNKAFYVRGTIPWVKSGELRETEIFDTEEKITEEAIKKSSAKIVSKGSLLLAMYGATVGRLAFLGIDAATNQAVCNIQPDEKIAFTKYLYYALLNKVPEFLSRAAGGAQPNISQTVIKDTVIPLPPLEEQKRIAAILDKADAIRRKRQRAIDLADQFLRSVFLEMFGDPVTNPKDWEEGVLADYIAVGDRINYGVVQPGKDYDGGIPLVRAGDIHNMCISTKDIKFIDPEIEKSYKRSRLHGDEVLIACVGSIGEVGLVSESLKGANIARAVARVRFNGKINRFFGAYMLSSESIKNYFIKETRTVAQPTLNIKQICETRIIVPPVELQTQFLNMAEKIEKHLRRLHQSKAITELAFGAISHLAFSNKNANSKAA